MLLLKGALSAQNCDSDKILTAALGISYSSSNSLLHFKAYLNSDFSLVLTLKGNTVQASMQSVLSYEEYK